VKECRLGKKDEIGSWPLHGESDGAGRRRGRSSSSSPRKKDDPLKTFQLLFRPCCLLRDFFSVFLPALGWLPCRPCIFFLSGALLVCRSVFLWQLLVLCGVFSSTFGAWKGGTAGYNKLDNPPRSVLRLHSIGLLTSFFLLNLPLHISTSSHAVIIG
jgi:hypothetical protein